MNCKMCDNYCGCEYGGKWKEMNIDDIISKVKSNPKLRVPTLTLKLKKY